MSIFDTIFTNTFEENGIAGLNDELKGLYLAKRLQEENRSIICVCSTLYEANKLYQTVSDYGVPVFLFPMDDFLTSEALAISPELKITRLETLKHCLEETSKIIVTNLMGYLRYLPTKDYFSSRHIFLEKNKDYNIENLIESFYALGYKRETIVNKTGEMALRGFVIDIFPMDSESPVRLEFWGDILDSIRIFHIDTQLTEKEQDSIIIAPNTEFLIPESISEIDMKHRMLPHYGAVVNIASYLHNPLTIYNDNEAIKVNYELLLEEMMHYSTSINLPVNTEYMFSLENLNPKQEFYFLSFDNQLSSNNIISYSCKEVDSFPNASEMINKRLSEYLKENKTVVICLSNRYKVNHVLENLNHACMVYTNETQIYNGKINLIVHSLQEGFALNHIVFISENELFHKKEVQNRYKTNFKFGTRIRDINKLSVGDYIVHNIHGIGRYIGMKTLTKNGLKKDYLQLEYKDGDKLYIPVEKIELISKYSSNENAVPKLNKLGSTEWEKTKLRVRKKIENIASELLKLYAEREASIGFSFDPDSEEQFDFEKEFPYTETEDQLKVSEEIKHDMESPHPMDRLLCGDVGYGKTEIAFRAMFKAVMSSKQVALLCPTTILSSQHYQNALQRFSSFPIEIALLNRFVSAKKVKETLTQVKEGKIDILIGTHRILSNDVVFKDLGLLVIDEEQRFGVKHKEKIKTYKNNVDVLTLSATPIPRTLQMSMAGIRSLSLIETPPVNRYPVQTYVLSENKSIIKDAIYKELSRDGQVFILYNHIDDMDVKVEEIGKLVPSARMISAHGKMDKNELEMIMQKFTDHEYDVLICTTIIETGIDIPNVNTLIIIDADRFGLSQLYQIRGRVGRGNKIAYCYLMYQPGKILTDVAVKRLKVIKDFTELGSGFSIAMRDLAIRGAGDILGSEQAGFVDSVGVELFMRMLEEEIARLKGEVVSKEDEISKENQPLIDVETAIDDAYINDEDLKIEIHKKINTIQNEEQLSKVKEELEDRFGKLSEQLLIYMHEELFETKARHMGISHIKQTKNSIEMMLTPVLTESLDGETLFMELNQISRMFRFQMKFRSLSIILDTVKLERHFIYYLLEALHAIEISIEKKNITK